MLSLSGLWLAVSVEALAVFDLVARIRNLAGGPEFIPLPGTIPLPRTLLPWLVLGGFAVGILVGHFFW